MAKCPQCKKVWRWDWEQDIYRDKKGMMCDDISFELKSNDEKDAGDITVFQCTCRKVLGMMNGLGTVVNCSEWGNIDWDKEENRI